MERGAWQAMIHRTTKSWTWLKRLSKHTCSGSLCHSAEAVISFIRYVCISAYIHIRIYMYTYIQMYIYTHIQMKLSCKICFFCFLFLFFSFIFISCRLITLQYCSGFCHPLTWISHGPTCVPHPDPPSRLPPNPIPLGVSVQILHHVRIYTERFKWNTHLYIYFIYTLFLWSFFCVCWG